MEKREKFCSHSHPSSVTPGFLYIGNLSHQKSPWGRGPGRTAKPFPTCPSLLAAQTAPLRVPALCQALPHFTALDNLRPQGMEGPGTQGTHSSVIPDSGTFSGSDLQHCGKGAKLLTPHPACGLYSCSQTGISSVARIRLVFPAVPSSSSEAGSPAGKTEIQTHCAFQQLSSFVSVGAALSNSV